MQKAILIALTLVVSSAGFASSSAGFTGGRGDGYAHGDFITPQLASVASHFLGGGRDGYSSSSWRTYQPATVRARFAGNGHDGYASSRMLSSWLQTKPKRFFGGSFDGYDRNASFGIPNWVLGDTDANGLPDWWELKYFGVLTGTPPQGDADHEGVSNLNEYLAGTTPTNASSYFHITRLTPGSPNKIFVYCAPGYFYTLQRADDLALGWTVVSNQTRISPASEGILEMDDYYFSDTGGFYRVRLEH